MLLVPEGVCACTGRCIVGLVGFSLAIDRASFSSACGVFRDTSIDVWLSTGGVAQIPSPSEWCRCGSTCSLFHT